MAVLGLKTKKSGQLRHQQTNADEAKAFLEQMEKKKHAAPDQCMFC